MGDFNFSKLGSSFNFKIRNSSQIVQVNFAPEKQKKFAKNNFSYEKF